MCIVAGLSIRLHWLLLFPCVFFRSIHSVVLLPCTLIHFCVRVCVYIFRPVVIVPVFPSRFHSISVIVEFDTIRFRLIWAWTCLGCVYLVCATTTYVWVFYVLLSSFTLFTLVILVFENVAILVWTHKHTQKHARTTTTEFCFFFISDVYAPCVLSICVNQMKRQCIWNNRIDPFV